METNFFNWFLNPFDNLLKRFWGHCMHFFKFITLTGWVFLTNHFCRFSYIQFQVDIIVNIYKEFFSLFISFFFVTIFTRINTRHFEIFCAIYKQPIYKWNNCFFSLSVHAIRKLFLFIFNAVCSSGWRVYWPRAIKSARIIQKK